MEKGSLFNLALAGDLGSRKIYGWILTHLATRSLNKVYGLSSTKGKLD